MLFGGLQHLYLGLDIGQAKVLITLGDEEVMLVHEGGECISLWRRRLDRPLFLLKGYIIASVKWLSWRLIARRTPYGVLPRRY